MKRIYSSIYRCTYNRNQTLWVQNSWCTLNQAGTPVNNGVWFDLMPKQKSCLISCSCVKYFTIKNKKFLPKDYTWSQVHHGVEINCKIKIKMNHLLPIKLIEVSRNFNQLYIYITPVLSFPMFRMWRCWFVLLCLHLK